MFISSILSIGYLADTAVPGIWECDQIVTVVSGEVMTIYSKQEVGNQQSIMVDHESKEKHNRVQKVELIKQAIR